jgi:hypothetical protein
MIEKYMFLLSVGNTLHVLGVGETDMDRRQAAGWERLASPRLYKRMQAIGKMISRAYDIETKRMRVVRKEIRAREKSECA